MNTLIRQIELELDDHASNAHKYYTIFITKRLSPRQNSAYAPNSAWMRSPRCIWTYEVTVEYGRKGGFGSAGSCQRTTKLGTDDPTMAHLTADDLSKEKRKKGYTRIEDWSSPITGLDLMLELI